MVIVEVEIKNVGKFRVRKDLLHRGNNPRLKLYHDDKYKEIQFNCYEEGLKRFQKGLDYYGKEILIKVIYDE